MMAPAAELYWMALRAVRGVGPRTARLLLERFGSAEEIFRQPADALIEARITRPVALGITASTIFRLSKRNSASCRRSVDAW